MAQLILTRSSQFHRALRTDATFPIGTRIGKFFLMFSLTTLIGILSFFYLIKFTEIHTKGYQLRRLEVERDRLLTSQESKRTNIETLKSLKSVRDSEVASRMIPAKNPQFMKQDNSVAILPSYELPGSN